MSYETLAKHVRLRNSVGPRCYVTPPMTRTLRAVMWTLLSVCAPTVVAGIRGRAAVRLQKADSTFSSGYTRRAVLGMGERVGGLPPEVISTVYNGGRGRGCPWDERTCSGAAMVGHPDCLQWALENGGRYDDNTC